MQAKNLGREFIGIEMDEGYFKIAQDRIKEIAN
jgi:DNA modification methylase